MIRAKKVFMMGSDERRVSGISFREGNFVEVQRIQDCEPFEGRQHLSVCRKTCQLECSTGTVSGDARSQLPGLVMLDLG